jgi:membrane-associated phospholipid phosphatase
LYLFVPAIGPRFTLYEFSQLSVELPGLYFTDYLREIINTGGGIINPNMPAIDQINRDCMPSGHTMITIITIILSFRYKSKLKYPILIIGSSLIFSTVYLRYHYVIDVFAGFIFAYISLYLEKRIHRLIK